MEESKMKSNVYVEKTVYVKDENGNYVETVIPTYETEDVKFKEWAKRKLFGKKIKVEEPDKKENKLLKYGAIAVGALGAAGLVLYAISNANSNDQDNDFSNMLPETQPMKEVSVVDVEPVEATPESETVEETTEDSTIEVGKF